MPGPADLFAQIQAQKENGGSGGVEEGKAAGKPAKIGGGAGNAMLAQIMQARQLPSHRPPVTDDAKDPSSSQAAPTAPPVDFGGKPFIFDQSKEAFLFAAHLPETRVPASYLTPCLVDDSFGNPETDIQVPLAPCVYRMCDYTYAKKEPVELQRCLLKLGVLRCLQRECQNLNQLLWHRFHPRPDPQVSLLAPDLSQESGNSNPSQSRPSSFQPGTMEEDELAKARFMELLSNCGVFQKVSELILQRVAQVADHAKNDAQGSFDSAPNHGRENPYRVPQVHVDGLEDFLQAIETLAPSLSQARQEINDLQTVSFFPGLGELFAPGSMLTCFPEGMEGNPLGCQVVQCWYDEELNKATQKVKRRFILVVEFIVSVGDEMVFVAASDVYPEFHDPNRNLPIKDLTHRRLWPDRHDADRQLLQRLQQRGEFYASVATKNHYLEYHPNSFFPIIGGGWSNNAIRPLSKGGRVMVDVKRGILEGHIPVRGTSDGMSDTVKEAIKLFEQSKRTGVAVPFRTCILAGFDGLEWKQHRGDSDRNHLWQAWPMLTGFSFTARVWGKLLLGMPKSLSPVSPDKHGGDSTSDPMSSPKRQQMEKLGVFVAALGGVGSCGNCGYINFQEKAFDQLVLGEDKKELIRAVARNAGGGPKLDASIQYFDENEDDDDDDEIGIDVVANKGGASIFLLHGPPGCGKTLTAEAIAELLRKPLYVVTAGDLGITASEVEKTLGSVLELCQTWDALVLIDEADVFLEARNSHEIQRNALVCVMLRLLEYYSGCLFLSSNRSAGSIDAAIASRITVMLSYPPLDSEGRFKVWKNLIELVPVQPVDPATGAVLKTVAENRRKASKYRTEFSQEDYQALAAGYQLNGRQIKNSIVLARALARERGAALSMTILRRAVTAVAGEEAAVL